MIEYKAVIPLAPITKKNHQQIYKNKKTKKSFITQSDAYKQFEADAGWFIKRLEKPIEHPVNVKMVYYIPKNTRVDMVNLMESTLDILVKYGVLKDDNHNIVWSMDGSRVYVEKENPRTEVTIEPVEL